MNLTLSINYEEYVHALYNDAVFFLKDVEQVADVVVALVPQSFVSDVECCKKLINWLTFTVTVMVEVDLLQMVIVFILIQPIPSDETVDSLALANLLELLDARDAFFDS